MFVLYAVSMNKHMLNYINKLWFIKTHLGHQVIRVDMVYTIEHDFTIKTIRLCTCNDYPWKVEGGRNNV